MNFQHSLVLFVTLLVGTVRAEGDAYPRAGLLIEPAQLARPEVARRYIVLDARDRSRYEQGHVPGARWVDHAGWAEAFGQGKDAEGWGKRIGGLGIGPGARVVVYDDNHTRDAARIWWLLRYWRVEDVRLLNGGWSGWKSGGHPTEKGRTTPAAVRYDARAQRARLATRDELLRSLSGGKLQIVDARSEKEYCGVEKLKNKRAGAIPGARHLEWIDLLDKETQRFKPAADLRKLFDRAGIALDRPTATHCQSGGRAAVMAFAMELMGAAEVSNYYSSWAEWGNAEDTPVVQPRPKKP
jgi:thiosulfate/3-mercaptopyruvate sulfurtransferase